MSSWKCSPQAMKSMTNQEMSTLVAALVHVARKFSFLSGQQPSSISHSYAWTASLHWPGQYWSIAKVLNCFETLQWRHNEHGGVWNHQPHDCLLNRLFKCRSKKTSKLRVTGLCEGKSPETGEFAAQRACNAENVSIWWRHHGTIYLVW